MLRSELSEMITLAERLAAVGMPAVLATLFSANGSTYRPLGSMMVGGPGSRFLAGGVSGGCLEEYIAHRGRALTERYAATMLSFETGPDGDHDGAPTLGCGGSIEVLLERCTAEHLVFLRWLRAAHAADTSSAAACVIDASELPSLSVQRLWLDDDWDSVADPQLEQLRERSIAEERSRHGGIGRSYRALVHYVRPMTRLVILGAGNDVRPLCTLARSLDWHVTVADRRARLATRTRFPDADHVVAADWWSALKEITFTAQTAVVVMTHSLADDREILPLLSEKPLAYVGVLGPEHRRDRLVQDAEDAMAVSKTFASALRGPIGLDLGDRSAAGIALSIVAEILAEMNRRTSGPLSRDGRSALAAPRPDAIVSHA